MAGGARAASFSPSRIRSRLAPMRRRSSRVKSGPGAEYPSSGTIQLTMLVQNNRRTEARILEWNIGECHRNFREIKRKGRPNPCVSDFMVSGANF